MLCSPPPSNPAPRRLALQKNFLLPMQSSGWVSLAALHQLQGMIAHGSRLLAQARTGQLIVSHSLAQDERIGRAQIKEAAVRELLTNTNLATWVFAGASRQAQQLHAYCWAAGQPCWAQKTPPRACWAAPAESLVPLMLLEFAARGTSELAECRPPAGLVQALTCQLG